MGFFIAMFICSLLIPAVMIIAGYLMKKKPPKEINSIVGYRTRRSMKNKDTWLFAHEYCGKLWFKVGIIVLILTAAAQMPFIKSNSDTIGTVAMIAEGVQVLVLLLSIVPVERALKQTFDDNGCIR